MDMMQELPYEIVLPKISESHLWTMKEWCVFKFGTQWNPEEKYGPWTVFWCGPAQSKDYRWHFKNQRDATMFILRWS
jgi:hypothetical protein